MTLHEIREILGAELLAGSDGLDMEVKMACGADLMSDVLAFVKSDSLLLTGLTNQQVVYTAEMANIRAICFVRGKRPDPQTISLAKSRGIPLLSTKLAMFESCGRLYERGLVGCMDPSEQGQGMRK